MNTRRISVIVPVRNGEQVIDQCLESLMAQCGVGGAVEILVVDNQSTDGTAEAVSKWPVRLLTERTRLSSYAARNTGIQASSGDYLAFTDADCIASPHWLATIVKPFTER